MDPAGRPFEGGGKAAGPESVMADGEAEAYFAVVVVAPVAVGIEEDVLGGGDGKRNPPLDRDGEANAAGDEQLVGDGSGGRGANVAGLGEDGGFELRVGEDSLADAPGEAVRVDRALGVPAVVVGVGEEDGVAAGKDHGRTDEPAVEVGAIVVALVGPEIGPAGGEGGDRLRGLALDLLTVDWNRERSEDGCEDERCPPESRQTHGVSPDR